ncbi:hypothetical protein [Bacillus infantis]|uniref:hypothetical protein n=1 Tax=Bacillus infantis TaxID=324767 RepID=UPI00301B2806
MNDDKYVIHQLKLDRSQAKEQKVKGVFFSDELVNVWNQILDLSSENENKLNFLLSPFRYKQGIEKDLVCMTFHRHALTGQQPWLIVSKDMSNLKIQMINSSLIRYLKQELEDKKEKYQLYSILGKLLGGIDPTNVTVNELSLDQLRGYTQHETFLNNYILQYASENIKSVLDEPQLKLRKNYNKDGELAEWEFPEEWFQVIDTFSPKFELVSKPLYQKDKDKKVFSYVINLAIETNENDITVTVVTKGRLIMTMSLFKNGNWTFNRKSNGKFQNRSLYKMNHTSNRIVKIPFSKNKYQNKIFSWDSIKYESITGETIEAVGDIAISPEKFINDYMIPITHSDRSNYKYLIKRGLHPNDHFYLFESFQHMTNDLLIKDCNPDEVIDTQLKKKEIGSRRIHDTYFERQGELVKVFVVSTNENIFSYLNEVMEKYRGEKVGKNGDIEKVKEARFDVEQISDGRYRFYDLEDSDRHTMDIEFVLKPEWLKHYKPLDSEVDRKEAIIKRIEEIIAVTSREDVPSFVLGEVDQYEEWDPSDPKKAYELGFLQQGLLSQSHYSQDASPNDFVNRLKGGMDDILIRLGFVNQKIYNLLEQESPYEYYYFPQFIKARLPNGIEGDILLLVRSFNGKTEVKYYHPNKKTNWLSIQDGVVELRNIEGYFMKNKASANKFIIENCTGQNNVVVYEEIDEKMPLLEKDLPFVVATFKTDDLAPAVTKISERTGNITLTPFVVRKGNVFYTIGMKLPNTMKYPMHVSKQTFSNDLPTRVTQRVRVSNGDVQVAIDLLMLRMIPITFGSYLNNPLPYHIFNKHFYEQYLEVEKEKKKLSRKNNEVQEETQLSLNI